MSSYVFWGIYKQHVSSFNYGKIQTTGAVLVAIIIPIFTSQLEKSREATDLANLRAAYAEASVNALDSKNSTGLAVTPKMVSTGKLEKVDTSSVTWYDLSTLDITTGKEYTVSVTATVENGKDKTTVTITPKN